MSRVVDPIGDPIGEDREEFFDPALRPKSLDEYVGQERIKANLRVYIRATPVTSTTTRFPSL